MKQFGLLYLVFCLVPLSCSRRAELPRAESEGSAAARPAALSVPGSGAPSFAVVELFTSEGCSSCPPADVNLARIAESAEKDGRPVYALSYHVDYWNYLGWRDPFSSKDFSERQRHYARTLGSGVYTPQMVINGRSQVTGSDESGADREISDALSRPASAKLELRVEFDGKSHELSLSYEVESAPPAALLTLAVVQSSGDISVRSGENGGRTLRHRNVVRAYETRLAGPSGKGDWKTTLATDIDPARAAVVGYVQDPESLGIVGAIHRPL